ncbi:hypothetical protein NC653_036632 [Populus alba x Populus x berolinensis]|uniref:Uncharacterized protein n=1 Tax=Populus alba x Populus x berolinensis TaxID=444605 RepID=A0AAD6LKK1_9ROSI|nr:hypothetical protein NC653_036632 [Populus alba x Populus x berolinensis]
MFVHEQKMKGKKKHAPAWCVRIICFGEELKHQDLSRGDSRLSDHCLVREIFVAESDVPISSKKDLQRKNKLMAGAAGTVKRQEGFSDKLADVLQRLLRVCKLEMVLVKVWSS